MLNDIWEGHKLTSLRNVVSAFISLYKAQNTSEEGFEQLYRRLSTSDYSTSRTRRLLAICKDAYTYYTHRLQNENKIDFDDMITQSVDLLDRTELFKYKYIIVDEFQDISQSRVRFLKKLIQHGNSKLFAVGDDWQAIYRFQARISIFS